MRRTIMIVGGGALVLLALLAGLYAWLSAGWDGDCAEGAARAELRARPDALAPRAGDDLRVLTWNVAFGGGPGHEPTERHTREVVLANLQGVVAAIRARNPDLVLLQEVDRGSDRSGQVDQLALLQDALGYPHACFVTTWAVRYLPFPYWPPSAHIGRVWSGQAILSRFPIETCARTPLPQPDEYPWWYNRFFLHRSLQTARVALPGGPLTVVNVHLEAFSQANREAQARLLGAHLAALPGDQPWLVGGDLNALPPDASVKAGFVDEDIEFSTDRTIEILRQAAPPLREVFLDDAPDTDEASAFTFPAHAPTRRLDYLFSRGLGPSATRDVPRDVQASDHVPVLAVFPAR